eukprot:5462399-Prymnesium_polylepis.1
MREEPSSGRAVARSIGAALAPLRRQVADGGAHVAAQRELPRTRAEPHAPPLRGGRPERARAASLAGLGRARLQPQPPQQPGPRRRGQQQHARSSWT